MSKERGMRRDREPGEASRPLIDLTASAGDPTGVLWAINRYLFHPRGFALALHVDEGGEIEGWSILGDGTEPWTFDEATDDEAFKRFEELLRQTAADAPEGPVAGEAS